MKVSYLRNKNNKRFDVRDAVGSKLKHYNVTQGACSDGKYIYVAFEQKENKKKKREHRIKIVKLDPKTRKILKVSAPLKLGHANDMCVSGTFLYITHSGSAKYIHKVNTATLAKGKDIPIVYPDKYKKRITGFNGISTFGEAYILRCMGGHYVMYLDKNFKFSKVEKFTDPFKDKKEDSQGMVYSGGIVYRAYSRLQSKSKNYICKFSPEGKLKSKIKVETKGELENLFFIDGKLYGMIYRKKTKGKNQYMSYIFKAK